MNREKTKKLREFQCAPIVGEPEQTFLIFEPTAKDVRDSEWRYKIAYSEALRNNVLTSKQMSKLLADQGYGRDEDLFADYYERIAALEVEIAETEDLDTKYVLALRLQEFREALYVEEMSFREPFYNTAESVAEEAQIDCLTSKIVCDEKGNPCWESQAVYDEDTSLLKARGKYFVTMWFKDIEEGWEDDLVENKVFQDIVKANKETEKKQAQAEQDMATEKDTEAQSAKKPARKRRTSTKGRKKKTSTETVGNDI